MRARLVILPLLISSSLFADPIVPPLIAKGTYAFLGGYRIDLHKHFEFVDISTEAGVRQKEALKADGYSCFDKSDIQSICNKAVPVDQENPVVAENVMRTFQNMRMIFSDVIELKLINNSSGYREWSALQKVEIDRQSNGQMKSDLYYNVSYVASWGSKRAFPGAGSNPDRDILIPEDGALTVSWNLNLQPDSSTQDNYVIYVTIPKVD